MYRFWGMDIIGMTASPEVFLAREAEMCYATMAHISDFDVWHSTEEVVNVDMVVRTLEKNIILAQEAIKKMVERIEPESSCGCQSGMENAILTNPNYIDPIEREKLSLLVGKYLN